MEFKQDPSLTNPDTQIPTPTATHDLRITVDLNPKISVGPSDWGHRNWISFSGGHWTATWGRRTIEPGGQDSQLVTSSLATRIETSYLLKTDDEDGGPAYICIKTSGWRTGPREVLEMLMDEGRADGVDARLYAFRLFVGMETGDERYRFLNTGMWVGSGVRKGRQVVYDAYRVG
jgi:hypothetical protein